jgi:hypothetical protein
MSDEPTLSTAAFGRVFCAFLEQSVSPRPYRSGNRDPVPRRRRRLISLYGDGLDLRLEDADSIVARTEGVSASFIKELLRRASPIAADEGGDLVVEDRHVTEALDELLVAGGTLTLRLLGGETPGSQPGPEPTDFIGDAGSVAPMR